MKIGDAVLVEWIDSHGCPAGWEFLDDLTPAPPLRCFTLGFILFKRPDFLTLVQTDGANQIMGRMTIPTRAIMRTQKLRLPSFAVPRLSQVRAGDAAHSL